MVAYATRQRKKIIITSLSYRTTHTAIGRECIVLRCLCYPHYHRDLSGGGAHYLRKRHTFVVEALVACEQSIFSKTHYEKHYGRRLRAGKTMTRWAAGDSRRPAAPRGAMAAAAARLAGT